MSLIDNTEPDQTDTIAFELELRHAPEKVWRALTTPELLEQWLLPVIGFELAPGARFTFLADPQPGWDGKVHCTMTDAEPPRRLTYA
jgi:uncharacterized protein YndB with AHSA1/START domain